MPIDGHLPTGQPLGLRLCTSCRVGLHVECGPIWEPAKRRVLYCECPGFDRDANALACLK